MSRTYNIKLDSVLGVFLGAPLMGAAVVLVASVFFFIGALLMSPAILVFALLRMAFGG